jgi:hypothetical protein
VCLYDVYESSGQLGSTGDGGPFCGVYDGTCTVQEPDKTVKSTPLVLQVIFARPVIFATTSMLDLVFLMLLVCEVASLELAWSCAACLGSNF